MARPELPTGTVTLLFTDVEGSARLLKLRSQHQAGRILRPSTARSGGVLIDQLWVR